MQWLCEEYSFDEWVPIPTPTIPTPVLAVYFSQIHALKHFIYRQSSNVVCISHAIASESIVGLH